MAKKIGPAPALAPILSDPVNNDGRKLLMTYLGFLVKAQKAKDESAIASKAAALRWEAEKSRAIVAAVKYNMLPEADSTLEITDGESTLRIGAQAHIRVFTADSKKIFDLLEGMEKGLAFDVMGFGIGAVEKATTEAEFLELTESSRGEDSKRSLKIKYPKK